MVDCHIHSQRETVSFAGKFCSSDVTFYVYTNEKIQSGRFRAGHEATAAAIKAKLEMPDAHDRFFADATDVYFSDGLLREDPSNQSF